MRTGDFIVVRDAGVKQRIHDAFKIANAEAVSMFSDERQQKYQSFKLAGILDAPVIQSLSFPLAACRTLMRHGPRTSICVNMKT